MYTSRWARPMAKKFARLFNSARAAFFDTRVSHPNADSHQHKSASDTRTRRRERTVPVLRQRGEGGGIPSFWGGDARRTSKGKNCRPGVSKSNKAHSLQWYSPAQRVWARNQCHSRLAELIATKKQENYATTISWIRAGRYRLRFCAVRD